MTDSSKLTQILKLVKTAKMLGISPIGIVCATREQYDLFNGRAECSIANNVACVLVAQSGSWIGYGLIITFDGWEKNYSGQWPSIHLEKQLDSMEELNL